MNNVNIIEIINYSGLGKFLYKKVDDQTVKFYIINKKYILIQLDLSIKELGFIKLNYEKFINILNNLLFLYNNSGNNYYQNITFNTVTTGNNIYNNCIFIFQSNNEKKGYIKTNGYIKINNLVPNKSNSENEFLINIVKLIKSENISVRNLIKIGIQQNKARKLYNFLKNKNVFKISEYNQNHKIYNIEEAKKISKNDIISFLI